MRLLDPAPKHPSPPLTGRDIPGSTQLSMTGLNLRETNTQRSKGGSCSSHRSASGSADAGQPVSVVTPGTGQAVSQHQGRMVPM